MLEKNFTGLDAFVWFFGIVEDRQDPLGLGRVRVRAYGFHTDKLTEIPSDNLPWASVLQSPTDRTFTTPREADLVFGFFADGRNAQQPIVVGIVPGYFTNPNNTGLGFNDLRTADTLKNAPRKLVSRTYNTDGSGVTLKEIDAGDPEALGGLRHPTDDEIDSQSVPGITRYEIDNTVMESRKNNLDKRVKTAGGVQWSEPYPAYNPLYPYNSAQETESGHVVEVDDTPGSERIAAAHRSGSFYEYFPTGTKVEKIVKSNYQIIMGEDHLHVMGRVMITVDSDALIRVVGDVQLQAENNLSVNVAGDADFSVGGSFNIKAKSFNAELDGDATIVSDTMSLTPSGDFNIKGGGALNIEGSDLNLNGDSSCKVGGGGDTEVSGSIINISGGAVNIMKGSASPGSADGGSGAGLPDAVGMGTKNTGVPKDEVAPVPLTGTLIEFDPETGQAFVDKLFLDFNANTNSYMDPGANTANVANTVAASNVSPCMFDTSDKMFIADSSTWALGSAGEALIKAKEGFAKVVSPDQCTAYPDPATGGQPFTIGYGTTAVALGQPVTLGELISRETAEQFLIQCVNNDFLPALQQSVTVALTQNMIDALLSLIYNIGANNFKNSTLVQKLNAQDWCGAADQFLVWNKANGVVQPGLVTRRKQERQLFLS